MSNVGGTSVPRVQVFRPSMEEFQNFSEYMEKVESQGAMKAGLAKIIPPEGWTPRKNGYDDIDLFIPAPISQVVTGRQGLYQQINIQQKGMYVKEFEKLANSNKYRTPPHFDYEDLERKYWKNITYNSPIYGADVSGSLYDNDVDEFNIQRLNTILDMVKDDYEIQIEGVNTAYLYFGMWKTTFAWHTEDMDLYSINYLHFGAPKSWYVVPPEHGRRLERLAAGFFHGSHQNCSAFLRHKMTIISPQILKQYSIPFHKITQEPGEFMITFPFAYHSGFNHGFNCAESTNFALPRWVEYGKRSTSCTCRNDCVKICMDMFVKRFQPDIYELWKVGKDIGTHPEDPSRHYAAPPPKKYELLLSAQREKRKMIKEQSLQKIKRHPISKLEKCEQISSKKDSKFHPRDSDEDTELYDINENLPKKNVKKQVKKKRKEVNFKNKLPETKGKNETDQVLYTESSAEHSVLDMKDEETEEEQDVAEENTHGENDHMCVNINDIKQEKMDTSQEISFSEENGFETEVSIKTETEVYSNDYSENGRVTKNDELFKTHRDVTKSDEPLKTPEEVAKYYDALTTPEVTKYYEPLKTPEKLAYDASHVIPNENLSPKESPPELKPFWAPDVKNPNTDVTKSKTLSNGNTEVSIKTHIELLNKYPHLKEAIDSGTFSVVPVSPNVEPTCTLLSNDKQPARNEKPIKTIQHPKSHKSFPFPNNIICSTWRCEQTSNALKLKIVQPKKLEHPVVQSQPTSSTTEELSGPPKKISRRSVSDRSSTDSNKSLILDRSLVESEMSLSDRSMDSNKSPARRGPGRPRKGKREAPTKTVSDSSPGSSQSGPFVKIQRADNSLDSWAHPIRDLWQHQPKNFEAEIEFNEKLASIPPYCAICVIFTPMYSKSNFPTNPSKIPSYSSVKMPAYCYGNSLHSECMIDTNSLLRADGTAPLLTCYVCKVTVHATCYGISMLPMGSWTCTRCMRQANEAECCLCALRGGALKPTNDNRWAHVICAILITEVYFENTSQKQPINVSNIPTKRQRLNCKYCVKTANTKGTCVQCQRGKCYLPYHVTCGYMAGVIFETCDWPEPINMICTKHVAARRKPPKRELTNVSVGERVIAKHKNKRYYWANVKKKYIQEFYSILFEDNSHSTNTLPEDIVSRNVSTQGPPHVNENVQIKWTDGKIYDGIFKGSQSCELCVIEFDDGSVLQQERKMLYAADEALPKEIQSKVSHSSERRSPAFETEAGRKRVRVSNHKYSLSYVH